MDPTDSSSVTPTWSTVLIEQASDEVNDEPMGMKEKFWIKHDGARWLAKLARFDDTYVRGEDWAEWLVHHLASAMGIPSATIRPAIIDGNRGILSKSVLTAASDELVHGNEVMMGTIDHYSANTGRENPNYEPAAVKHALSGVAAPADFGLSHFSGFDVWTGYLVLDAWVSGRDRHDGNWAIVKNADPGSVRTLAPTYDHGNALGFQEREDRHELLANNAEKLERWASRGRSPHFSGQPLLTVLAADALTLVPVEVAQYWIARLMDVPDAYLLDLIDAVPHDVMSHPTRRFVFELLQVNRRRLLNVHRRASQT